MAAKHLTIARTQGAKAGFNAYREIVMRGGLPIKAELLAAGNKKAQFDFYCGKFLAGAVAPASKPAKAAKASKTVAVVKTPSKPTQVAEKPRTWSAFWVEKKGIPAVKGAEFTYTSKKYNTVSTHTVVKVLADGGVVTLRTGITR